MTNRTPPRRLALATDLSHRCDRALDRALLVAKAWQAELAVVHALPPPATFNMLDDPRERPSWRRPPDPVRTARESLYRDLVREDPSVDMSVHVEAGSPPDVIMNAIRAHSPELLVTGVARDEPLERMLLGNTVDRIIRQSPIPVLIVRARAFEPYQRIVVATDFSPSSQAALKAARKFFPEAALSLFHAYDVPFASYLGHQQVEQQFSDFGRQAADKFLSEAGVPPEVATKVHRMIEHGVAEGLLRDFAETSRRHLTVVGTHGGGRIYKALIGSTARKIIDAIPGDVLLVPDPERRKAS